MTPEVADPREFHLGLTMSGAISAGAYTAGVFDFLIQALDEWERAKRGEIEGVKVNSLPGHFLGIKVISGASAGAITAAFGAVALADKDQAPRHFPDGRVQCWLPKLYEGWVERPQLCAETDGASDFLSTDDVGQPWPAAEQDYFACAKVPRPDAKATQPAMSLLNSRLLDRIAHDTLKVDAVRPPRRFLSQRLHIYFTLTNLRGVPYRLQFTGGDYHMLSHGDRAHFVVTGLGEWRTQSLFCDGDLGVDLDTKWLPAPPPSDAIAIEGRARWKDFTICALASAAFPVRLSARHVYADTAAYGRDEQVRFRRYPSEALADTPVVTPNWAQEGEFPFMTADGGTIDNDPFEYARFGVKAVLRASNERAPERADRAVVMISPFAEAKPPLEAGLPSPDIVSVFKRLLPSLIDQARFKPGELALALNEDFASRFLIAPRRTETPLDAERKPICDESGKPNEQTARYAIASGLLGGFGGFVARGFRDHDFQLGRRNCQRFLQTYFALPEGNHRIEIWPEAARKAFRALDPPQAATGEASARYCLAPLVGTAAEEVAQPSWPRIGHEAFARLRPRLAQRYDKVTPALIKENITNRVQYLAFRLLATSVPLLGVKSLALNYANAAILADLIRRDQIEGFADVPCLTDSARRVLLDRDQMRAILSFVVHPTNAPRSPSMIVKEFKTDPAFSYQAVKAALERLTEPDCAGEPHALVRAAWTAGGEPLYALAIRPPPRSLANTLRGVYERLYDGFGARLGFAREKAGDGGAPPA